MPGVEDVIAHFLLKCFVKKLIFVPFVMRLWMVITAVTLDKGLWGLSQIMMANSLEWLIENNHSFSFLVINTEAPFSFSFNWRILNMLAKIQLIRILHSSEQGSVRWSLVRKRNSLCKSCVLLFIPWRAQKTSLIISVNSMSMVARLKAWVKTPGIVSERCLKHLLLNWVIGLKFILSSLRVLWKLAGAGSDIKVLEFSGRRSRTFTIRIEQLVCIWPTILLLWCKLKIAVWLTHNFHVWSNHNRLTVLIKPMIR